MTRKDGRDRERYGILLAMLEDRRRELSAKLRSIRETLPEEVRQVKDAEEQSMADIVQEVDFALMQMKSETLAKIDDAIVRLKQGRYGLCLECGHEIAAARLKAVPFADLCRDCQQHQEDQVARERQEKARDFSLSIG
jgi:DnaK suppressor protein